VLEFIAELFNYMIIGYTFCTFERWFRQAVFNCFLFIFRN